MKENTMKENTMKENTMKENTMKENTMKENTIFVKSKLATFSLFLTIFFISVAVATITYSLNATTNVVNQDTVTEGNNFTHVSISSTAPYDSLVSYWSFDADNSTTAYDIAGTKNGVFSGGAYANSSVSSLYGFGSSFDGTNDQINISSPVLGGLKNSTIMAWVKMRSSTNNQIYVEARQVADDCPGVIMGISAGKLNVFSRDNACGVSNTVNTGTFVNDSQWHHVVAVFGSSGQILGAYVDGVSQGSSLNALGTTSLTIGSIGSRKTATTLGGQQFFNGSIDELMIFNASLNSTQITDIYNNQSARFKQTGNVTLPQINANFSFGQATLTFFNNRTFFNTNFSAMLGYWGIDKGYNNSDLNSSANGLVSYYHAEQVINNTNVVVGQVGNALSFDGTNDYISLTGPSLANKTQVTVSAWINVAKAPTGANIYIIFGQTTSSSGFTKFGFGVDSGRKLSLFGRTGANDPAGAVQFFVNGTTTTLNLNQWYHIVGVFDNVTSNSAIYINGVLDNSSSVAYPAIGGSIPLSIGIGFFTGTPQYFNGSIDQVRIFNRSLSATEIANIYSNESLGVVDSNMNRTGLVGEWTFNESQTSLWATRSPDSSGLGNNGSQINTAGANISDAMGRNNGTAYNGTTLINSGQYNNSFTFDGVDDWVNMGILSNDVFGVKDFTISVWAKTNALSASSTAIMTTNNGTPNNYFMILKDATNKFWARLSQGASSVTITDNITMGANTWYNLVIQREGDNLKLYRDGQLINTTAGVDNLDIDSSFPLAIGRDHETGGRLYFNGSMDEVMIFNRSLSSDEIKELYIKGRANWNYTDFSSFSGNSVAINLGSQASNLFPIIKLNANNLDNNVSFYTPYFYNNLSIATETGLVTPSFTDPTPSNNSNISKTYLEGNLSTTSILNIDTIIIYLYNSSGLVNSTTFSSVGSTTNWTLFNFTSLANGIYYLNATVNDSAGISGSATTRTITLDTNTPSANITAPSNNTYTNSNQTNFTLNVSDSLTGVMNATLNITNSTGSVVNSTTINATTSAVAGVVETISIPVVLVDDVYSWVWSVWDWAGNLFQTSGENRVIDTTSPKYYTLLHSPNFSGTVDPNTLITIQVNLTDNVAGINTTQIYLFNSTDLVYNGNTLTNISGTNLSAIYQFNFTTQSTDTNYTYYLFFNDSSGNSNQTSNQTFQSLWDCTWNLTTTGSGNDLGTTGGFNDDLDMGNITLINNGDVNYSNNNCTQTFTFNYNQSTSLIYPDFSLDYLLEAVSSDPNDDSTIDGLAINSTELSSTYSFNLSTGQNATLIVSAGFPNPDEVLTETPAINITSSINDTIYGRNREQVATTLVITPGAYLETAIETPSTNSYSVDLTNGTHNFIAYVKDVVSGQINSNNTAYNVSFNWTLPIELADYFTGNISILNVTSNQTLNDTAKIYLNISLELNEANLESSDFNDTSSFSLAVYVYGYENSTGNLTLINHTSGEILTDVLTLNFDCYGTEDNILVSDCGQLDGDYVAPVVTVPGSSSGGGGGGGGGGGVGKVASKSEATYELVRGENNEFILEIKNDLDAPKRDIKISVSGITASYISLNPTAIDYIAPHSKEQVRVQINAPSYLTQNKTLLQFKLEGIIDNGNNSLVNFVETKYVTLSILEFSREKAENLVNESANFIKEMNESNFSLRDANNYYEAILDNYNASNFLDLKTSYELLKTLHSAAFNAKKILEELKAGIIEAEKRGIKISDTKKALFTAEVLFDRGDYLSALEKLNEAKLTFAIETKGEFNLLYEIKNNPVQFLGILLSLGAFGLGSSVLVRYRLYIAKLKLLGEEEKLLLQLMKVVQKECFEGNKLSMEEYQEAMSQYEKKLSEVIETRVTIETKLANVLKLKGKKKALEQEKKRVILLIQELQDSYMNKGKVETRVYQNMLNTYSSRLSKVEEELSFMEAKEFLGK